MIRTILLLHCYDVYIYVGFKGRGMFSKNGRKWVKDVRSNLSVCMTVARSLPSHTKHADGVTVCQWKRLGRRERVRGVHGGGEESHVLPVQPFLRVRGVCGTHHGVNQKEWQKCRTKGVTTSERLAWYWMVLCVYVSSFCWWGGVERVLVSRHTIRLVSFSP